MGTRENWLLYYNCLPDVLWLLVFCCSSPQCHGLTVCSVWLWYFLIILSYIFHIGTIMDFSPLVFHNRIFLLWYVKPLQYNHARLIVTMHLRILWTGTERGSQMSFAIRHGANWGFCIDLVLTCDWGDACWVYGYDTLMLHTSILKLNTVLSVPTRNCRSMAVQLLNPRNTLFQTARWNELHANFVYVELTTQSK